MDKINNDVSKELMERINNDPTIIKHRGNIERLNKKIELRAQEVTENFFIEKGITE